MPSSEDEEAASRLLEAVDELSPVGTQPARPTAAMVTSTICFFFVLDFLRLSSGFLRCLTPIYSI